MLPPVYFHVCISAPSLLHCVHTRWSSSTIRENCMGAKVFVSFPQISSSISSYLAGSGCLRAVFMARAAFVHIFHIWLISGEDYIWWPSSSSAWNFFMCFSFDLELLCASWGGCLWVYGSDALDRAVDVLVRYVWVREVNWCFSS